MTRYSNAQITLHWLTAVLMGLIIALPYGRDFFGEFLGGGGGVFVLHKSLGLSVLALTMLRLLLRARHGAPRILAADAVWQQRAAKAGHALLYLLLILMPLSGLLFGKRTLELFWLIPLDPLPVSEATRDAAQWFHVTAQWLLFAMILGHALMALAHHYGKRDGVLAAMLPAARN